MTFGSTLALAKLYEIYTSKPARDARESRYICFVRTAKQAAACGSCHSRIHREFHRYLIFRARTRYGSPGQRVEFKQPADWAWAR